ncbi:winged helix-turn-helix transcriptional regulator [Streptomyces chromofuscus]|uniref:winged helix-turn-helix transcriptional regulator n=1 Tax=Streptomyces chromofuscus TaxID=42881 RepID=UPI00167A2253|nr:helix-turn-helix domain-containing protein [Streptomyces chromofuscus]GGT15882.1 putative HTH-type transcriptional regulator YvaP [Streptomyces chromofuscus]
MTHPVVPGLERSSIHDDTCPSFHEALELVGRRWTGSVLFAAARGARRFGEFRAAIDGISDRLLSQRLKELESQGLIRRTVIPTTPVRVQYSLAPSGQALIDALQPLAKWSMQRSGGGAAVRPAGARR